MDECGFPRSTGMARVAPWAGTYEKSAKATLACGASPPWGWLLGV
jgi:hypothetical protein